MSSEFTAGVLRITWDATRVPFEIPEHPGKVFPAHIAACATQRGYLPAKALKETLHGLVVRSPEGALSQVSGIEAYATMLLGEGMPIGLLLVPVDER